MAYGSPIQRHWADQVRNRCREDLLRDLIKSIFPLGVDNIILSYDPYKYVIPIRYQNFAKRAYCICGNYWPYLNKRYCVLCGLDNKINDMVMVTYGSIVHNECYKYITFNAKYPENTLNKICVKHICLREIYRCDECSLLCSNQYPNTCYVCDDRVSKNMIIVTYGEKYGCFLHDSCYEKNRMAIPAEYTVIKITQQNHNTIFCSGRRFQY
jgi:hypothetical protein